MSIHELPNHKIFCLYRLFPSSPRPAGRSFLECPETVKHSYYDRLAGAVVVGILGVYILH